jgi:hypothetical protein
MLLFAISVGLLAAFCAVVAAMVARERDSMIWAGLAAAALQLGLLAQLLSLAHMLKPVPWLACQALLLAGALAARTRLRQRARNAVPPPREPVRDALHLTDRLIAGALAGIVVAMLAGSAWLALSHPVRGFDELMYHCSRVARALQEETLFFAPTHNERQTSLPFGGELWFLWPVLFTRSELAGRTVAWLAFPLTAWGALAVCRRLGIGPRTRWVAPALWCATPLVFRIACGQKTDIWMSLWVFGAFWSLARLHGRPEDRSARGMWAACGMFCALASSVRLLAAPLTVVIVLLAALRRGQGRERVWRLAEVLAGIAMATVLSGAGAHSLLNLAREGGVDGSPALRDHVSARVSPAQLLTHLGRMQFDLLELPAAPPGSATLERALSHASRSLGLERLLPKEGGDWPGRYEYFLPRRAIRLGFGGLLWTPLLAALAVMWIARGRLRDKDLARRLRPLAAIVLAGASATAFALVGLVWQQGFMLRFHLAGYATVPLLAAGLACGGRLRDAAMGAALALQAAVLLWGDVALQRNLFETDRGVTSQFDIAAATIPADARVLLVAGQDGRDYRLHAPDSRYSRRIGTAGRRPTTASLAAALADPRPDFVLFERAGPLSQLDWHPHDPSPLLRFLDASGQWTSETLSGTRGQVLYRSRGDQAGRPSGP